MFGAMIEYDGSEVSVSVPESVLTLKEFQKHNVETVPHTASFIFSSSAWSTSESELESDDCDMTSLYDPTNL